MDLLKWVRLFATLGPIVALLAVGLAITLRSGVVSPASGDCRREMAANLGQACLQLLACLIGLAALQQFAGFHVALLR